MGVTRITVSVPAPQLTQAVSNLIGLAGLIAMVVFVGGVTGNWWWSLGLAGATAVGLSWVAQTHVRQAEAPAPGSDAEVERLRPVPPPARAPARSAAAA